MNFFILFALVMMHSIMFPMIHEVSSSDDYLSCTASSGGCKFVFKGTQGAQKFEKYGLNAICSSQLVIFLGKSFITSEQSGVCSQLQEDPPVPLGLPGYDLPVSFVSSYLHPKIFPRLSMIIFLQGFRNLPLLSVTSFQSNVFRWDKTNR